MAIAMTCDRCRRLIDPEVNGGVRLKMGRKEYTFHLCKDCQTDLRMELKNEFLDKSAQWKES